MINTTSDILFLKFGEDLDAAVRAALEATAESVLQCVGLADINLDAITAKTNILGAFAKYIRLCTLESKEFFDEQYVRNALTFSALGRHDFTADQFNLFTRCGPYTKLQYTKVLAANLLPGIGFMLIRLHCLGAITLPATFNWPVKRNSPFAPVGEALCAPNILLSFVRSCDKSRDKYATDEHDQALGRVNYSHNRAEWFWIRGTKVTLALGWSKPEHINLDDAVSLHESFSAIGAKALVGTMEALLNAFKEKFGDQVKDGGADWKYRHSRARVAIRSGKPVQWIHAHRVDEQEASEAVEGASGNLDTLLERLASLRPTAFSYDRIMPRLENGTLKVNPKYSVKTWLNLEEVYSKRVRLENEKGRKLVFGVLNLYLFYYLPAWFGAHPDTSLEYPDEPNKFHGAVFISRLIDSESPLPKTLIEFMNLRASLRKLAVTTQYQNVSVIDKFFDFIELHGAHLPGSDTFQNTLTKYDAPSGGRPWKTNKRAIPRGLFALFISYIWCIKQYVDVIVQRTLNGEISSKEIDLLTDNLNVVDTFADRANIGFVPCLFWNGATIPVQYVPYIPPANWYKLHGGRVARLMAPHALNQILVALMTGLRHNHIQWLDLALFDSLVEEEDIDFTRLYVNTDKVKKTAWTPDVNMTVITVLRSQREWRELLDEPSFTELQYYNNNNGNEYPPFLPLFSYGIDGLPHGDAMYSNAWHDLLCGFQGILPHVPELGALAEKQLFKLLPVNIKYNDPNEQALLSDYESSEENVINLRVTTDITPHSSRVSVVTHSLTFLPPEFVGERITGQTLATLLHYYKPDPDDHSRLLVQQGLALRDAALQQQAVSCATDPHKHGAHHIQADVNSALARSVSINLEGTIADYGLISLIMREEDQSGIDVLRERGTKNIAFNKTEICPYDNNCPAQVISLLKGIRRCALCPFAVRSIDHLPAIVARKKQTVEQLIEVDGKLDDEGGKYTDSDLDALEEDRQRLAEEIAGWEASEQILEAQRARIAAGADTRRWVTEMPSIIVEDLQKIETPNTPITYLLTRLAESVSYPGFQSPKIKALLDVARRRILASLGKLDAALSMDVPVDPAAELAGMLRGIVAANNLTPADVVSLLQDDKHLQSLPKTVVLGVGYEAT